MDELDGDWEVRRVSGALPPSPACGSGSTVAAAKRCSVRYSPFDVVGRELRYRGR